MTIYGLLKRVETACEFNNKIPKKIYESDVCGISWVKGCNAENARLLPFLTLMAQEIERLKVALEFDRGRTINSDNAMELFWRMSLRHQEALTAHELAMKQILEGE